MNKATKFGQALWDYQQSDRYKENSDPETLKAPASQREFLENRLYWAFSAGWNAALAEDDSDG